MKLGPRWSTERRFWRSRAADDVEDELAFHLDMRTQVLEEQGLDPVAARVQALQRFGDLAEVSTQCITISQQRERRMHRGENWNLCKQDVRYALRRLAATPMFTIAVLLMLALGIGATTTAFSVLDAVMLRPLPFNESSQLVDLSHTISVSGLSTVHQSDASYLLYARHAKQSFEGIGAYRTRDVTLGSASDEAGSVERVAAGGVTATLFPVLRAVPQIGRAFRAEDDRRGAPRVVMLSAALWQRKFGADPGVIGRRLVIDGVPHEVVGVMPATFQYPQASIALWTPLAFDPANTSVGSFNFNAVGRLRGGVAPASAARELEQHLPRLLDEYPTDIPRDMWAQANLRPVITPLRDVVIGDVGHMLWLVFASVFVLLAIVVANVASLFLVRAEGAQRELAIRMALGAGTRALTMRYLIEACVLALAGAGTGLLIAQLALVMLRTSPVASELPRLAEVTMSARVLLFASVIAVGSAIAVNMLPLLRIKRVSPGVILKESSRSASSGRARQRARSVLVVAQLALALVLVASSALMARSFAQLRVVDPGMRAPGVLSIRLAIPSVAYANGSARAVFFQQLVARAQALPGVVSAAITEWLPLTDDHNDTVIQIDGLQQSAGAVPLDHPVAQVSPSYFSALGIPILRGRTFDAVDPAKPSTDVVVSRAFAEKYWPGESPIGKRLRPSLDGAWFTIVGVAGDVHMASLESAAEEFIYFPLVMPQGDGVGVPRGVSVVIRTGGDPAVLTGPVRVLLRELNPALTTYDERPFAAILHDATARTRFITLLLGAASVVALVIGMVGLYGVLAYGVLLRQREIGVRLALGASAQQVTAMIARHGLTLAAAGIGVGLVAAMALTRLMRGLLFGVSPTDPLVLATTCLVLLVVAGIASWLPARRAAAIAPMEAMRCD